MASSKHIGMRYHNRKRTTKKETWEALPTILKKRTGRHRFAKRLKSGVVYCTWDGAHCGRARLLLLFFTLIARTELDAVANTSCSRAIISISVLHVEKTKKNYLTLYLIPTTANHRKSLHRYENLTSNDTAPIND